MTSKDRAATESAVADRQGDEAGPALARPGLRVALLALGWICVALGVVGMAIPGLPTTVFLIIALWAFSRSSHRFHDWLYEHPHLGPPLRAWHAHGVIQRRAKLLAVAVMTLSLAIVTYLSDGWIGPAALAALLVPVAAFILTRPGRMPEASFPEGSS